MIWLQAIEFPIEINGHFERKILLDIGPGEANEHSWFGPASGFVHKAFKSYKAASIPCVVVMQFGNTDLGEHWPK